MFRRDRPLFHVLLVSTLFWFLGGVIQPTVNAFGTLQIHYGAARTSAMVVCMAIGIMVGCLWAGRASRGQIRFGFVTLGAWGIVGCLAALAFYSADEGTAVTHDANSSTESSAPSTQESGAGAAGSSVKSTGEAAEPESFTAVLMPTGRFEWVARGLLIGVGLFAGFFYVPLAVFMQARPPAQFKGRMIGAMNLMNWIGIVVSAGFFGAAEHVCDSVLHVRLCWIFGMCALVMLPVAIFYRPNIAMVREPPKG
jgi:hypothetical protein